MHMQLMQIRINHKAASKNFRILILAMKCICTDPTPRTLAKNMYNFLLCNFYLFEKRYKKNIGNTISYFLLFIALEFKEYPEMFPF